MVSIKERGVFVFRVYDSDGNLIEEKTANNALTSQGSGRLFKLAFVSATTGSETGSTDEAYVGLIDNSSFSSISADDVATDIRQTGGSLVNGWFEISDTTYNSGTRKEGTFGVTDNSGTVTASKATWTDATFTFAGSHTLKGAFLANDAAVGQNSGSDDALFATAIFSSGTIAVDSTTTLKVTFEMSLS